MADGDAEEQGRVAQLKGGATGRWARLKAEHGWIQHVVDAYALMQRNNANQYAAAITYFSFLALFPLILLAVSVVGFVLISHQHLQTELFAHVTDQIPGKFGTTVKNLLQTAIDNRAGLGVIGIVGVLLSGLGWIANLRQAIDAVWGTKPAQKNFIMSRVGNLLVLGGLGLGILISLGLTAVGTSLTDQILSAVGLDSLPGATYLLKVIGIAIAVAGDMIIFGWLLARLPRIEVDRQVAIRGALLASVGFEILKIVGTYTIARASHSASAGPFASIIAVLVWIQLVARYLLFCCAWMAIGNSEKRSANSIPIIEPEAMVADRRADVPALRPATVGATLVGAGAIAGAVATWAATRPRPDPHD